MPVYPQGHPKCGKANEYGILVNTFWQQVKNINKYVQENDRGITANNNT